MASPGQLTHTQDRTRGEKNLCRDPQACEQHTPQRFNPAPAKCAEKRAPQVCGPAPRAGGAPHLLLGSRTRTPSEPQELGKGKTREHPGSELHSRTAIPNPGPLTPRAQPRREY